MLNKVANKMSPQELCDFSVKALVNQGKQSRSINGCAYSDDYGNHCGIGHITDPKYHENWEESMIGSDMKFLPKPIKNNIKIFQILQDFHDCTQDWSRQGAMNDMKEFNIDTSGSHWQEWVDLIEQQLKHRST